MTKPEIALVVSPPHILKDLAVIGCQVRTDGTNLLISGLQDAEQRGMINQDMKTLIKDTLRAHKHNLIEYLQMSNQA